MCTAAARFVVFLVAVVVALTGRFASSFSPSIVPASFQRTESASRRNSGPPAWGGALSQQRRCGRSGRGRAESSFAPTPSASTTLAAGPAILEKEAVRTGGPAVLERPETARRERVEEPRKQKKGMGSEAWEVRIYNDGMNTREHVARALVQVTGMSEMDAYQTMMQAHLNGLATVGRYIYEVAEMFHDALKKNGIVCDIVPVEED
jgi:ATP-dependent Clp protease adapter protein ClpS